MADAFILKKETDDIAKLVDNRLKKSQFVMVGIGTGGGKTYIGIHAIGRIAPDAHIIVFAPKKKVIEKDWDKSIDSYNQVMKTDLIYDIFNYELLVHAPHYKQIYQLFHQYTLKRCLKKRPIVIILDEAHRVKDPTSQTSRRVQTLARHVSCMRTIGLSATPISNSYMDAVGYFILAGMYSSKTDFQAKHVKFFDQFRAPIVKDAAGNIDRNLFHNPDLLDTLLQHIIININLNHLKPKRYGYIKSFDYSPEQLKAYRQIKKDYRNGLCESVQEATQMMRTFIAENADYKNAELSKILNNSFVTRPVLIFYSYDVELEALREHLDEQHSDFDRIEINGKKKVKEEDLLEPRNPRTIFLIQYRSGSEGIDAKWSNLTVFYAPTNMYQAFKQAIGRNVRAGKNVGDVYQFRLQMNNTIDEHTWSILDKKENFTDDLMSKFLDDPDEDDLKEAFAFAQGPRDPKRRPQKLDYAPKAGQAAKVISEPHERYNLDHVKKTEKPAITHTKDTNNPFF